LIYQAPTHALAGLRIILFPNRFPADALKSGRRARRYVLCGGEGKGLDPLKLVPGNLNHEVQVQDMDLEGIPLGILLGFQCRQGPRGGQERLGSYYG